MSNHKGFNCNQPLKKSVSFFLKHFFAITGKQPAGPPAAEAFALATDLFFCGKDDSCLRVSFQK